MLLWPVAALALRHATLHATPMSAVGHRQRVGHATLLAKKKKKKKPRPSSGAAPRPARAARPSSAGAAMRPAQAARPSAGATSRLRPNAGGTFEDRLAALSERLATVVPRLVSLLGDEGGVAVVDDVLGSAYNAEMRREAEGLYASGAMQRSLSQRAAESGGVENYAKEGVLALGLTPAMYGRAPHCTEYILAATSVLSRLVGRRGALAVDTQTNKLAVTMDGGAYPLHLDNIGGDDRRLLTVIYYLNPGWPSAQRGRFLAYRRGPDGEVATQAIEPQGDRLVAFHSDELYHSVERAEVADGENRYALTIWLLGAPGARFRAFDDAWAQAIVGGGSEVSEEVSEDVAES